MKKFAICGGAFIIICLFSCNKHSDPGYIDSQDTTGNGGRVKITDPRLNGTWRWINTESANSNTIITPESAGYSAKIKFAEDSIFDAFRNDTLIKHTYFHLSKGKSLYDGQLQKFIIVNGSQVGASYLFPGGDSLILRQECIDCFIEKYIKIPASK